MQAEKCSLLLHLVPHLLSHDLVIGLMWSCFLLRLLSVFLRLTYFLCLPVLLPCGFSFLRCSFRVCKQKENGKEEEHRQTAGPERPRSARDEPI